MYRYMMSSNVTCDTGAAPTDALKFATTADQKADMSNIMANTRSRPAM